MKFLLALLLTCLPLCAATTLYPLKTDNAAQTFYGGATNIAPLNGTNTFTGTNNFTGTVIITNAASTISGNGAGLTNVSLINNGIGWRLLWSSPTNIPITSVTASQSLTNNGDYSSATKAFSASLPALSGSNSTLLITMQSIRSNANASAAQAIIWAGSNTNFVGLNNNWLPTTSGHSMNALVYALHNYGSFTNQIQGSSFTSQNINYPTNFCDTSVPFVLYFGFQTATSFTNAALSSVAVYELIIP